MNMKQSALELDRKDQPSEAANAYEDAIQQQGEELDTFLNLAVLYFCCNDGGYAVYHKLSKEFLDNAWERSWKVLDEAEAKFGRKAEIEFWRSYFRVILLGEENFVAKCEDLVKATNSLDPYFYLFLFPNGKRYERQVKQLYDQVADGSTQKNGILSLS
jgi:hypothetical protein